MSVKSLSEVFPAWTTEPYVHWSTYVSLYSAKTRCYMIKKGLNFTETTPGANHRWKEVIEPKIGFFAIPVLETPNGDIVQDTTAIIRFLEKRHPEPAMQPADPVMRALCWLIFNYGTEGLFLNAQHYRWNFKESADFAAADIGRALVSPDPEDSEKIKKAGTGFGSMKLKRFPDEVGITPETIPAIEKSNKLLFEKLDLHFRYYPYILGGRPSVADCALMEVLHAHLGRDVYPAQIMKKTAPVVFRWTETMNLPGIPTPELSGVSQEYLDSGNLPDTLVDFLKLLCADFGPQLKATATAYEDWLAAEPRRPEGALISINADSSNRQPMGKMEFVQQGVTFKRDAWPDILLMHQYVLEVVDAMTPAEKGRWSELMRLVGGEVFLEVRLSRPVVSIKNKAPYAFVLGPKTA
jgi:glutathione S-transferase